MGPGRPQARRGSVHNLVTSRLRILVLLYPTGGNAVTLAKLSTANRFNVLMAVSAYARINVGASSISVN